MVVVGGLRGTGVLCGKEEHCSCLAVPSVHAKLLDGGSVALLTAGFVVVAKRRPINHGVNQENKIGELQHTLRWRIVILKSYFINPLKPELNPSAQRCLMRFFTGDFAS
jgi:hypothetical protein